MNQKDLMPQNGPTGKPLELVGVRIVHIVCKDSIVMCWQLRTPKEHLSPGVEEYVPYEAYLLCYS